MRLRRRVIARRRLLPRRIRHHPAVRVTLVTVAVVLALSTGHRLVQHTFDERHQWGDTRTVIIARHRIEVGAIVSADDVDTARWPLAVIPTGAFTESPAGRTAIATIESGEAILSARVAPDGLDGVAALVPAGWRAIAIPTGPAVVSLAVGDHVDLIAGFDAQSASNDESPTIAVARDALVVAVDEQRVTVAVRDSDASRVAFAVVAGTVVPALRAT